jgi:aryl-alcohol dehydrogenase-like predicted oxidoreductase
VLYTHRFDENTPVEEFMRTLNEFVEDRKVNYLGTSAHVPNAWKVAKANEVARQRGYEPFKLAQPRYNLIDREIEGPYLDMCREYDIGVVPWSPLAQGFLTGKYERDADLPEDSTASEGDRWQNQYLIAENFDALDDVEAVAEEVGATPAQVAIAYLTHHDAVTAPIIGARTTEQLEENVRAATVSLSDDQFRRLAEASGGPFADL